MASQRVSLLSILTEDLLQRIFSKIDYESDRKSYRLVCKDFLRVDSSSRKTLKLLRIEFLPGLLRKLTAIEKLDLSACSYVNDATVSILLTRASLCLTRGLKVLILSRVKRLSYSGLEPLVRACPFLESVDVSNCDAFGDREAAALSCAGGLRDVKMDKCLNVTDVGLAKIAIGCPRLERVSLEWCTEIGDMGVDLLCKKCRELKFLDVSYLMVSNKSLHSIASLPELEVLVMMQCPLVDDVGFQFLGSGCPSLQVIDISRCEYISPLGLISLIRGHNNLLQLKAGYCLSEFSSSFLQSFKDLKNLNTIRLDGIRISDASLGTISTYCKSLEELGLSKCRGVTDMGIMQLVSGCITLKTLDLTCCRSMSDAAISAIANTCGNLACLRVESCNMITEKSLYELGSFCTLLEELDFTECSGLNDRGLEFLSKCPRLSILKLGLCINATDKGLSYLASKCSKICELDLYRCTSIGDDGLAALSSGCKMLKNLNLSYCSNITDRGMKQISHLRELYNLEIRGLVNVTSAGLAAVATGCKHLAELDIKHCSVINDFGFRALAYYSRNLRQINLSHTAISDVALCMVMGNLTCLQQAKLVRVVNVTVKGLELALRASSNGIKKVKLQNSLQFKVSSEILQILHARGCQVKWE